MYRRRSKSSHEWMKEALIVPEDGGSQDLFGGAVAISGGILVVGAMHHSGVKSKAGAVYAYQRSVVVYDDRSWSMVWNLIAKLAPEDLRSQDYFGCSVAIHRNVSVVGAYGADDGGTLSGAVHVYHVIFDEFGVVQFEYDEKIIPESPTSYDWFGTSVGVFNSFIIVGAPGYDYKDNPRSGAAYIFQNTKNLDAEDYYMWTEMEIMVVSDGAAEDRFGS